MRSCNAAWPGRFWWVLNSSAAASYRFARPGGQRGRCPARRYASRAQAIWLDSLDVGTIEQGWRTAQACRSVGEHAIKIHGATFAHGVGTHAQSLMDIDLKGAATRFTAMIGIDDETDGKGIAEFEVLGGWQEGGGQRLRARQPAGQDARGRSPRRQVVDAAGQTPRTMRSTFVTPTGRGRRLELSPAATARPAAVKLAHS